MNERENTKTEQQKEKKMERLQPYTILLIFRVLFVTDVLIAVVCMIVVVPTVIAAYGDAHTVRM